ncbi:TPA: glycosyltransferase family 4 protein [Streptococcus suis]|nr:glycosyltransferase family 4 protein [Streptococcus suis]
MKILFVSPVGALFSGAEVAIVNLMRHLSSNGHEIYNVIPDNETNVDKNYIELMDSAEIKCYQLKTMKWWWYESSFQDMSEKDAVIAYQHKNIAEVREIIRNNNIELVISNTVNVFQGAIAAACEGLPHYYIIHEFPFGEFGYYREKIELINLLSDKIFAVQGGLFEELAKYFPSDKLFPFIPYSNIVKQNLLKSERKRIISIGGITERKNQLELIKAFHLLNQEKLELVFIGSWDEEYKSKCDSYIEKFQLKNISFLGFQNNPWQFITDKDIAVFTSSLETFGLVFVEAILNGVPAIVSDNPGHFSVQKYFETGEIYPLGNIEILTNLLKKSIQDFESIRLQALQKSTQARKKYTIEEASINITKNIDRLEPRLTKNYIGELSNLFNLSIANDVLNYLKGQKISVFISDVNGQYSPTNVRTFPINNSGLIEIGNFDSKQIRVDLTENPGVYSNVCLIVKQTNQTILPINSNSIEKNGSFIFYDEDPQIFFDITQFRNEELILKYSKEKIGTLGKKMFFLHLEERTEYETLKNKLFVLEKNMIEATSELEDVRKQYLDLEHQYHAIINSKRWRIATHIAKLFRRK